MSIDLDWHALDASLTESVVESLSNAFASAARPEFLGELNVTSFSFGDSLPEVELLDIRDIYKEFLQVHEDELHELNPASEFANGSNTETEGEERWRDDSPVDENDSGGESFFNGPLKRPIPHLRPSSALFTPGLNPSYLGSPARSAPRPNLHSRNPSLATDMRRSHSRAHSSFDPYTKSPYRAQSLPESSTAAPSLQLHVELNYSGNLTVGFSTSLLINYPSPKFMQLPISLTLTSLSFSGVLLIAFEGDRKRIHLSFLDPGGQPAGGMGTGTAAISAGARLLNGARIETQVGETEKHVLKNVGKVEKFVLDVTRKTLESELIFP